MDEIAPAIHHLIQTEQGDNASPRSTADATVNKVHSATEHAPARWQATGNSDMYVVSHIISYIT